MLKRKRWTYIGCREPPHFIDCAELHPEITWNVILRFVFESNLWLSWRCCITRHFARGDIEQKFWQRASSRTKRIGRRCQPKYAQETTVACISLILVAIQPPRSSFTFTTPTHRLFTSFSFSFSPLLSLRLAFFIIFFSPSSISLWCLVFYLLFYLLSLASVPPARRNKTFGPAPIPFSFVNIPFLI